MPAVADINNTKYPKWSSCGVEQSILDYVATEDYEKRNTIFSDNIYLPMCQMVYGLLSRYKPSHINDTWDNIAQDTVTYLTLQLDKWKPLPNSSAFSFFYTVAKYYLWNRNTSTQHQNVKHISIYDMDGTEEDSVDSILMQSVIPEDTFKDNDDLTGQQLEQFQALKEYVSTIQSKKQKTSYNQLISRIQTLLDNPELIIIPTNARFPINENIAGSKLRKLKDRVKHNLPILIRDFRQHRRTETGDIRVTEDGKPRVSEESEETIYGEIQMK